VKCDLFSLGVVMWEALSSERLFDAATGRRRRRQHPRRQDSAAQHEAPNLPIAITSAVHRALERDPTQRFDSHAKCSTPCRRFCGCYRRASIAGFGPRNPLGSDASRRNH